MGGSVFASMPAKCSGSAGSYADYVEDEIAKGSGSAGYSSYHERPGSDIVFDSIGGGALDNLPGLEKSLGLTKEQFEDVWHGRWQGAELVKPGFRKVYQKGPDGKLLKLVHPETGKEFKVPKTDLQGKPVMEQVHVPGYDMPVAFDKSLSELVMANPELESEVDAIIKEACHTGMRVAIEGDTKMVKRTVSGQYAAHSKKQGSVEERAKADGLIWAVSLGKSARPTPESRVRGYVADAHYAAHIFVSSMARVDGRWKKIEGKGLFESAEYLASVVSVETARLLEERLGVRIEYGEPDRYGNLSWNVAGSKESVRKRHSTNSDRSWRLAMKFEKEHGRPWSPEEKRIEMAKTKGAKTAAAKEADLGGLAIWERWRKDLLDNKLIQPKRHVVSMLDGVPVYGEPVLDAAGRVVISDWIEAPGQVIDRQSEEARLKVLYERLEAPEGLIRDCGADASWFGPETIRPAVMRAAVGLGFTAEECIRVADWYRDTQLIEVRSAPDIENRLYTTRSVRDAERWVKRALAEKARQRCEAVPMSIRKDVLRELKEPLNDEQLEAFHAICSDAPIVHVDGPAGVGKNKMLAAAMEALRRAGVVSDTATVAVAAKRGGELGFETNSDRSGSIRSLWDQRPLELKGLKGRERDAAERRNNSTRLTYRPGRRSFAVLDEAPLANVFDAKQFLEAVGPAKVVTLGDLKQNPAIGPAGWYVEETAQRTPVTLKKVYRQKNALDLQALDLIREGRAHEALDQLSERGRVHVSGEEESIVPVVSSWYQSMREAGYSAEDIAIVNQGSNEHGLDVYNRMVQRDRLARGEIGCDEKGNVDPRLEAEIQDSKTGRRWSLYEGDRFIFNATMYIKGTNPIRNGSTGKILRVGNDGMVRLQLDGPERREITVKAGEWMGPSYCIATAKMQGGSAKAVGVIPGSRGIASLNSGYSQGSRAVDRFDVFVSTDVWGEEPVKALGDAWKQEVVKKSSWESPDEISVNERIVYSEAVSEVIDTPPVEWDVEERDGYLYATMKQQYEDDLDDDFEIEEEIITESVQAVDRIAEMRRMLRDNPRPEREPGGMGIGIGL